jgi:hypothetical protein
MVTLMSHLHDRKQKQPILFLEEYGFTQQWGYFCCVLTQPQVELEAWAELCKKDLK